MGTYPLPDHPQLLRLEERRTIGTKLFGESKWDWKFVCPECSKPSSVREHADAWGGGITSVHIGRKCPKCGYLVRPRPDYGNETCYRVLLPPEHTPTPEEYPNGLMIYVMPFWVPDRPETVAEAAVREVIEAVGDPAPRETAPAPIAKPAPKKGAPGGYGFKF